MNHNHENQRLGAISASVALAPFIVFVAILSNACIKDTGKINSKEWNRAMKLHAHERQTLESRLQTKEAEKQQALKTIQEMKESGKAEAERTTQKNAEEVKKAVEALRKSLLGIYTGLKPKHLHDLLVLVYADKKAAKQETKNVLELVSQIDSKKEVGGDAKGDGKAKDVVDEKKRVEMHGKDLEKAIKDLIDIRDDAKKSEDEKNAAKRALAIWLSPDPARVSALKAHIPTNLKADSKGGKDIGVVGKFMQGVSELGNAKILTQAKPFFEFGIPMRILEKVEDIQQSKDLEEARNKAHEALKEINALFSDQKQIEIPEVIDDQGRITKYKKEGCEWGEKKKLTEELAIPFMKKIVTLFETCFHADFGIEAGVLSPPDEKEDS